MQTLKMLTLTVFFSCLFGALSAQQAINLWPNEVPGEAKPKAKAVISENNDRGVTRIAEVTDPLLEVFEPEKESGNGISIIICPGGGYNILAIDLEGYEVAKWFTKRGYTAFVLQYRVPQKQEGALMDAQRAIRMVRSKAKEWNLDTDKIGILGFSAGGSLAARASTRYNDQTYPAVDKTDSVSCRPDFAVLIYPAYLDQGENNTLTPELKVTEEIPPMFLFVAADDKHASSSLVMGGALRKAGVTVELHMLPEGGHGYGLRPGNRAAETWPPLAKTWLETVFQK